jgi:hypothetical protein
MRRWHTIGRVALGSVGSATLEGTMERRQRRGSLCWGDAEIRGWVA